MTARPVSGANNPLRRIWNRKGGASPESADVGGDSFTAMTISTGMPPRAAASRYVRHRRHAFISSTLNTGALHERSEERRVGKECRSRRPPQRQKKKRTYVRTR